MIKDIFTRATVATRLGTGPLGSHLNALATRLQNQRYATSTISSHLREAHVVNALPNEQVWPSNMSICLQS